MKEKAIVIFGIIFLVIGILAIRHHTHAYAVKTVQTVSKALDKIEPPNTVPECYSKEILNLVAIDSSKHTVDFIVNKMIADKFIIVNKDGESYRFKFVKKYKQPKDKK